MISIFKARRVARTAGFDDALLADEQHITEGATWNVFFIQQRELVTPPLAGDILPGVTRQLILDYCQQQGISVLQQPINRDQIQTFDGAFATNASWGVRPIAAIDDVQYSKTTSALMTQLCSFYDQLAGEFI